MKPTKRQIMIVEDFVKKTTKSMMNEAETNQSVSKFAKLSGLTPTKTISSSYPFEFKISNTMTMIVSKSGKFIMTYKLGNKSDEYLGQYTSAAQAWQAVQQGNYLNT